MADDLAAAVESIEDAILGPEKPCDLARMIEPAVAGPLQPYSRSASSPETCYERPKAGPQHAEDRLLVADEQVAPGQKIIQVAIPPQIAPVMGLGLAGLDDQFIHRRDGAWRRNVKCANRSSLGKTRVQKCHPRINGIGAFCHEFYF